MSRIWFSSNEVKKYLNYDIFRGLSHEEITGILEVGKPVRVRRGEAFYDKGKPATSMYIVVEGLFKVVLERDGPNP